MTSVSAHKMEVIAIFLMLTPGWLYSVSMALTCQNGGTFDAVRYICVCTLQAYGQTCENRFADRSPCRNAIAAGVISIQDSTSAHAARRFDACSAASGRPCIDFSSLLTGWYRILSPSGNYLVSGDYPCVPGEPIGCGTAGGDLPFTVRQQVFDGEPENGTKLYSARAYAFAPSSPQCYDSGTVYYIRVLECPDKSLLYYMEPTMTNSHKYCIGVYSAAATSAPASGATLTPTESTTGTATTANSSGTATTANPIGTATTANPSGTATTASPSGTATTANPSGTATTANPIGTATTANPSGTATSANPSGTATTANPIGTASSTPGSSVGRAGWNNYVDDGNPYFRINTTGLPNGSSLSCSIRSNSLQASFTPSRSGAVSKSTGLFCDFAPVLQWLAENKLIYVNTVLDVITSSTMQPVSSSDVTVCQSWFRGKRVRQVSERSQCTVEDAVDSYRPTAWRQWFGDL